MFVKKRFLALFAAITVCFAPLSYAATRTGVSQSRTVSDSDHSQRKATQQRTATKRANTSDSEITQRRAIQSRSTIQRASAANTNVANRAATARDNSTRAITRPTTTARTATMRTATRTATTSRAASNQNLSRAAITVNNRNVVDDAMSREELNQKNEMTEYCREQYASCMDQYCNILDEEMGRCSCSANLSNYEKTTKGLEQANAALQDVAQQIQYIGLSADDIDILFSETEAESAMASVSDSTQLKDDLDKIKKMIVDVKPGSADNGATTTGGLNLNLSGLLSFSFDDSDFSLDSIFGNQNSTGNIINQRGTTLHKTATQRCQTAVLTYCKDNGVDTAEVINSYDLKITKDCIAYEQNLDDQNKNMASTIRNANNVLQKARLMVKQNKNKYDLRGCVTALDECMRTDFVCGEDYENCLDPSGKYIVNGEVVLGSTPNLDSMWKYDSNNTPWTDNGLLADYIEEHTWTKKPTRTTSGDIAEFLQHKIGYKEGENNYGLCMGVLNQCQDYTYDKANGTYIYGNTVVREYLTRILPTIKTAQDNILNEFATNCVTDVTSCLNTNGYATSSNIATNACRSMITTCMSVTNTTGEVSDWVTSLMNPKEPERQEDEPNTYSIEYDLDGGTNYAGAPTSYTAGTSVTISGTPTKENYVFAGWCTDSGWTSCATTQTISASDTGNKKFYAKWTENEPEAPDEPTYTITYVSNGGSGCTSESLSAGASLTCTPTRRYYTFDGWYTAATGGTKVDTAESNQTVYAHWTFSCDEYYPYFDVESGVCFAYCEPGTFVNEAGNGCQPISYLIGTTDPETGEENKRFEYMFSGYHYVPREPVTIGNTYMDGTSWFYLNNPSSVVTRNKENINVAQFGTPIMQYAYDPSGEYNTYFNVSINAMISQGDLPEDFMGFVSYCPAGTKFVGNSKHSSVEQCEKVDNAAYEIKIHIDHMADVLGIDEAHEDIVIREVFGRGWAYYYPDSGQETVFLLNNPDGGDPEYDSYPEYQGIEKIQRILVGYYTDIFEEGESPVADYITPGFITEILRLNESMFDSAIYYKNNISFSYDGNDVTVKYYPVFEVSEGI